MKPGRKRTHPFWIMMMILALAVAAVSPRFAWLVPDFFPAGRRWLGTHDGSIFMDVILGIILTGATYGTLFRPWERP